MENTPELSQNSQYLLTNRAIDLPVLVEVLVSEELPFLFHYFHVLFNGSDHTLAAAQDTICRAVIETDHYNGSMPVRSWLVSLTLQDLSRYAGRKYLPGDQLPDQVQCDDRDGLESREGLNLSPALMQIFKSLPVDQRAIALSLYLFEIPRDAFNQFRNYQGARAQDLLDRVEARFMQTGRKTQLVVNVFQQEFPPPSLPQEVLQASIKTILERTRRLDARRKLTIQVKSLAWMGLLLLISGMIFWGYNRDKQVLLQGDEGNLPPAVIAGLLPPPPTPTPLWVDNVFYGGMIVEPIPNIARRFAIPEEDIREINRIPQSQDELPEDGLFLPVPDLAYPAPFPYLDLPQSRTALPFDSLTSDQFHHLLATSNRKWKSAWLDIQYLDYTYWLPNNRVIPTRTQVWVVQPDRSMEITGFTPAKPQERNIILKNRHYFTLIEPKTTIMTSFQPEDHILIFDSLFREMIFPGEDQRFLRSGSFHNLEPDRVAGRQAVAAEWFNDDGEFEYRIWIDHQTGVIVRLQQFNPYTQELLNERLVTAITYDFQISASFFDPRNPWEGGFAIDETGAAFPEEGLQPTPTFALPAP